MILKSLLLAALLASAPAAALADSRDANEMHARINASRQASIQRAIVGAQQDMQERQLRLAEQQVAAQRAAAEAAARQAQSLRIGAANGQGAVNVQLPMGGPGMGAGLVIGTLQVNVQNGDGNAAGNSAQR